MKRRALIIAALVALTVGCDQLTKHIARTSLEAGANRSLAGGLVVLTYAENQGAFLSLGARWPRPLRTAVFSVLSSVMVAAVALYLTLGRRHGAGAIVGLALIVGGGIGNLIDRLCRGGTVTDFLNVGIGSLRTGIFNLADLFLLAGVLLLVLVPDRRSLAAPPRQHLRRRGPH